MSISLKFWKLTKTNYPFTVYANGENYPMTANEFETFREQVNAMGEQFDTAKREADLRQAGYVRARAVRPIEYLSGDLWVKPESDEFVWHFVCGVTKGTMSTRDFEVINATS